MRPAFLGTPHLRFAPHEPEDEAALAHTPWRLLALGAPGDAISLAVLDAGGALLGAGRLEGIDWVARRASLALRWGGSPELAREAVDAMLRYARSELRLACVEARALESDAAWLALLVEAGFARMGTEGWTPGKRVLLHDKAFVPSPV